MPATQTRHAPPDLERLVARVDALERRLRVLEGRGGDPAPSLPQDQGEGERPLGGARAGGWTSAEVAALSGRVALGLGGAFLLRAATQAAIFTPRLGVLLGLAYALGWLAVADRAASRRRAHSAITGAVTAALIGLPLIWEATARFHFLGLTGAMVALSGISCAFVVVGARRRMPVLLWPLVTAMVPIAGALAMATGTLPPWLGLLLLASTALSWRARGRPRWRPVGTTASALFDLCLALVTAMAWIAPPTLLERALAPWQVLAVQTAAFVLGSSPLLLRAARTGRIGGRDAWRAGTATALGLGGALAVGHHAGASTLVPGAAALALGVAAFAIAWRRLSPGTRTSSSLAGLGVCGLTLSLAGLLELLDGTASALTISSLALAAAALVAGRLGRPVDAWLGWNAALLGVVALAASGSLLGGARVLFGGAVPAGPPSGAQALSLVAALACCAAAPTHRSSPLTVARTALIAVLSVSAGGLLVGVAAGWLPGGAARSQALLSPLRTGALAGTAILLAGAGRLRPLREGTVLVYPVLVAGGIKLVLEELRSGEPTVLVASLVLFGTALLLAPRLSQDRAT